MIIRRFRKEAVLAGLAAKAQAPVVVTDKAKLSPTVGTAVFQLGHGALPPIGAQSRHAPQARSIGMATNFALRVVIARSFASVQRIARVAPA